MVYDSLVFDRKYLKNFKIFFFATANDEKDGDRISRSIKKELLFKVQINFCRYLLNVVTISRENKWNWLLNNRHNRNMYACKKNVEKSDKTSEIQYRYLYDFL